MSKCCDCGGTLGALDNVDAHTNKDDCVRVLRGEVASLNMMLRRVRRSRGRDTRSRREG